MDHMVSNRPFTDEARVWSQAQFVWDFWLKKWYWGRFFSEYFGSPGQYRSTSAPYSCFCHRRCIIRDRQRRYVIRHTQEQFLLENRDWSVVIAIRMRTEQPTSPSFTPDGQKVFLFWIAHSGCGPPIVLMDIGGKGGWSMKLTNHLVLRLTFSGAVPPRSHTPDEVHKYVFTDVVRKKSCFVLPLLRHRTHFTT
jgi:hypothetical protein